MDSLGILLYWNKEKKKKKKKKKKKSQNGNGNGKKNSGSYEAQGLEPAFGGVVGED